MAREREEVQADFLNSLLVDNDIHPYEFYAALARLDDHPMLEHMNPHLVEPRDGPDTGMSELPRSYLGISGDYVGICGQIFVDKGGIFKVKYIVVPVPYAVNHPGRFQINKNGIIIR